MKSNNRCLFALDMDGTLLTSKKEISSNTQFYLKNLAELGHKIIFASGRPIRGLIKYYKTLNLDTPLICYNGAKVFSPSDDNFSKEDNYIKLSASKSILDKLYPSIILSWMLETDDEIWVSEEDEFLFSFFIKDGMKIKIGTHNDILDKDTITFIAKYNDTIENRNKIIEVVSSIKSDDPYEDLGVRFWDTDNYFELYYKHINKYNSIKRIAKYYNIPEENIYAFGDADNDIEVITHCPNGVAMKNSSKSLLKLAKKVTKFSNEEDGIIRWIDENLYKNN